jgi:hypothetical protein
MARPSPSPAELPKRAVRMVAEVRPDYDTEWAAMKAVASKPGIGTTETLRTRARQDHRQRDPVRDDDGEIRAGQGVEEGERRAEACE